jgi:ubiquinone biosynthesis protein COQ9
VGLLSDKPKERGKKYNTQEANSTILSNEITLNSKDHSPDYNSRKNYANKSVLNIKKAQSLQKMLAEAGVLIGKN